MTDKTPMTETQATVGARFQHFEDGRLRVDIRFDNASDKQAFVFNRLWTLDDKSALVVDPRQAYSWLRKPATLVLRAGHAPMPGDRTVTFRNTPHATPVAPGARLEWTVELPAPLREYNFYFEPPGDSEPADVTATGLLVEMEWFEAWPELKTRPSMVFDGAVEIISPVVVPGIQRAASAVFPCSLPVLMRTDDFTRP